MSAHTTAPWRLEFSENGGYDSMTDAWMIFGPLRERIITYIDLGNYGQAARTREISDDERALAEANARLIASAPELLDALNGLFDTGLVREFDHTPEYQAALAAIAKAEGRSL